jgi:hypothetical protein
MKLDEEFYQSIAEKVIDQYMFKFKQILPYGKIGGKNQNSSKLDWK